MSSVNTFKVGQRVTCIDTSPAVRGEPCRLSKGTVYTVSELTTGLLNGRMEAGVQIAGHEAHPGYPEGFRASRFAPVVEVGAETDIALFLSVANEVEKPLVNLTDALNLAWELYGVDE